MTNRVLFGSGRAVVASALVLCTTGSLAQEADPADAFLGGPAIVEHDAGPTLVRVGYDGRLEKLELPPEEAALELLELEPALQASVDAYLGERSAAWDAWVTANYTDIVADRPAIQGGGDEGRRARQQRARLLLQDSPIATMGPLGEGLKAILPADVHAEVVALTTAYQQALAQDRASNPAGALPGMQERPANRGGAERARPGRAGGGERMARVRALTDEATIELRRALERTIGQASDEFEDLIRSAGLSPEGEALVRVRLAEARGAANAEGRGVEGESADGGEQSRPMTGVFREVMRDLSDEDRRGLMRALQERRGNTGMGDGRRRVPNG